MRGFHFEVISTDYALPDARFKQNWQGGVNQRALTGLVKIDMMERPARPLAGDVLEFNGMDRTGPITVPDNGRLGASQAVLAS